MSLGSFLAKMWASIKSIFDGLADELKEAIHIGVSVVENIKKFVDSPGADVLTAIIPGDVDDQIKGWLRAKLPVILTEIKLVDSSLGLTDPDEIALTAIKVLQELKGDLQNSFLHSLSILIAQIAADGKLTWSDGVYLSEWYYQHLYKT